MERVPVLYQGRPMGELTARQEGEDTCFCALCRGPEQGLWCLWAVGSGGELRLGLPENGRLARRFSPRLTSPLGQLRYGELRPAAPPKKQEHWQSAADPAALFQTPWLRKALSSQQGVLTCRRGEQRFLALPFSREKPFPLPSLFCFASIRTIGAAAYAVFAFDGKEWPIDPKM